MIWWCEMDHWWHWKRKNTIDWENAPSGVSPYDMIQIKNGGNGSSYGNILGHKKPHLKWNSATAAVSQSGSEQGGWIRDTLSPPIREQRRAGDGVPASVRFLCCHSSPAFDAHQPPALIYYLPRRSHRLPHLLCTATVATHSSSTPAFNHLNQRFHTQVPVQSWFDDMTDTELLDLIPLLEGLSKEEDIYSQLQSLRNR